MPKYLVQVSYSVEGTKGLLKDGGSRRRAVVAETLKSVGGNLDAFYYAFGDPDAFLTVDLPDHATAAALTLTATAAGAGSVKTTVLLTPEEIDQAAATKMGAYRAPGA